VLTFGTPGFLLAGALAALVPLALHLIRRRPPARAPLPTERFLAADPRTAIRVSRPTDLLLLALRMLLLILAGAAFARPVWLPGAEGTSKIVLLDRGAAMAGGDGWRQAVAAARQRLLAADGSPRGELVLFDTGAVRVPRRRVTAALFDSLAGARPSASAARYAAGLRAIPGAAREMRGADSVRVTLITRPRWGGWSEGIAPLRRAVWPGAIDLVALPDAPAADSAARDSSAGEAKRAVVLAGPDATAAQYPVDGLRATGWTVDLIAPGQPLPDSATLIVATGRVADAPSGAITRAVEGGATVLGDADASLPRHLTPWVAEPESDTLATAFWLADGSHVTGASSRADGHPAAGAAVIAAWDDGEPAAVARRVGRGCAVYLGTRLAAGEMVLDAAYPRMLERLARGCSSPGNAVDAGAPLDAGARAVLAGAGARAVAASALPSAGGGVPLGRWLMGLALIAALAETFLAYRRKKAA